MPGRHCGLKGWAGAAGIAALTLGFGGPAVATDGLTDPGGNRPIGITWTKHNLTTTNRDTAANIHQTTTDELCVFCHTPHGGVTEAPLWNRLLGSGPYTPYASPTIDSIIGQPNGVALACLSCHDGTIAFDALRNKPGSGGFSNSPVSANFTWVNTSGGSSMPAGRITNLGTDLRDDHPVSMVYPHTEAGAAAANTDPKFNTPASAAEGSGSNRKRILGPGNGASGDAMGYDNVVFVFQQADSKFYVQCTSCHNPHGSVNTADSGGAASSQLYTTFLRRNNAGSALCLVCHIK